MKKFPTIPAGIFCIFLVLGITGMWHAFPLLDVFADEMYYAYGPLYSIQHFTPLPHNVPYGTVTFYLVLPLQVLMLCLVGLYTLVAGGSIADTVMQNPYLAYIAPRVLSVTLFVLMLTAALKYVKKEGRDTRLSYAVLIIGFSNITLIAFAHSGKMWLTSIFFLFFAGLLLARKPVHSVASASLAAANFPIMGVFWFITVVMNFFRIERKRIFWLVAIGLPLFVTILNAESIYLQIKSIFEEYIFLSVPKEELESTKSLGSLVMLYGTTLVAYLWKIILAFPLTYIALAAAFLGGARIRDARMFKFAVIGCVLYLLAVSVMFNSTTPGSYLRYLLPFSTLSILVFLSLEFPRTLFLKWTLSLLACVGLYTASVAALSLAMPTTFNDVANEITTKYSDPKYIVLSRVSQIALPYNTSSAEFTQRYTPGSCSNRCKYALEHGPSTSFQGTYLFVPDDTELHDRIVREATASGMTVVEVRADPTTDFFSTEYSLGIYFQKEAWVPTRLGQRITIEEWK